MIRRLRIKFVCINMTIVTIMLCVIFGTILHFTGANLEKESLGMMQTVALESMQPGVPGQMGQGVRLPYFSVQLERDGALLASGGGYYDLTDQALLDRLVALSSGESWGVLPDYDLRFMNVATPGARYIVFADISSELSTMDHLMQNCLAIGVGSFLAFLLLSILLANWAVKPVATAWEQQRRFVADASHELKTPLTIILSNAQMLAASGDDPCLREKLTDDLVTVARQMKELVVRLLDCAQADQGVQAMQFAPVNWSETVTEAMLPFDCLFYERGLTLDSDIQPGIFVKGSRSHLTQVVDILLDNAQKYSSAGGHTAVTLKRQGAGSCLLTVSNQGPPLSTREARDIFKRFYRLDTARVRTGSYGLGLPIAEYIVRAHRGRIRAESCGGINTFSVRLPVARLR